MFTYPLFLISSDKKFGRAGAVVISLEFVDFFHIANSAREILRQQVIYSNRISFPVGILQRFLGLGLEIGSLALMK